MSTPLNVKYRVNSIKDNILIKFNLFISFITLIIFKLRSELRPELRPELRMELRPELRIELRPELRIELRPELRIELRPELRIELRI
jgi:hypothetical protein